MCPNLHNSISIRLGKNYKQDRFYQIGIINKLPKVILCYSIKLFYRLRNYTYGFLYYRYYLNVSTHINSKKFNFFKNIIYVIVKTIFKKIIIYLLINIILS